MQTNDTNIVNSTVAQATKEIRQSLIKALYPIGVTIQQNLRSIHNLYPNAALHFNAAPYEDEGEKNEKVYRFGYCYANENQYWSNDVEDSADGKSDLTKLLEEIEADNDYWDNAKSVDKALYITLIKEKMDTICVAAAKIQQIVMSHKPSFSVTAQAVTIDVDVVI